MSEEEGQGKDVGGTVWVKVRAKNCFSQKKKDFAWEEVGGGGGVGGSRHPLKGTNLVKNSR